MVTSQLKGALFTLAIPITVTSGPHPAWPASTTRFDASITACGKASQFAAALQACWGEVTAEDRPMHSQKMWKPRCTWDKLLRLVGVDFLFCIQLGIIIPNYFHIFQRGWNLFTWLAVRTILWSCYLVWVIHQPDLRDVEVQWWIMVKHIDLSKRLLGKPTCLSRFAVWVSATFALDYLLPIFGSPIFWKRKKVRKGDQESFWHSQLDVTQTLGCKPRCSEPVANFSGRYPITLCNHSAEMRKGWALKNLIIFSGCLWVWNTARFPKWLSWFYGGSTINQPYLTTIAVLGKW